MGLGLRVLESYHLANLTEFRVKGLWGLGFVGFTGFRV